MSDRIKKWANDQFLVLTRPQKDHGSFPTFTMAHIIKQASFLQFPPIDAQHNKRPNAPNIAKVSDLCFQWTL